MGFQSKGGQYCPRCDRHVAAVRNTHHVKGTFAAMLTGGLSVLGSASDPWHCPNCGTRTKSLAVKAVDTWLENRAENVTAKRAQKQASRDRPHIRLCDACGTRVDKSFLRCPRCGESVSKQTGEGAAENRIKRPKAKRKVRRERNQREVNKICELLDAQNMAPKGTRVKANFEFSEDETLARATAVTSDGQTFQLTMRDGTWALDQNEAQT
jgi:uncharacterized protein with PIN domain